MLGAVAAVPVLGLGWWQSHRQALSSAEDWDRLLVERAEDAAGDVETILRIRLDEVELLAARAESIADWSDTARMHGLFDGRFGAAGFTVLLLGDEFGTSLVGSPEIAPDGEPYAGLNYRDRSFFKRMLATKRPAIGDAVLGRRTRSPNITLAAPVFHADHSLRGYVHGTLKLEQLRERVTANVRHGDSRIVVVDSVGSVVVDTSNQLAPLSPFTTRPQQRGGGPSTLITLDDAISGKVRRASAVVPFDGNPWRIYVSTPMTKIAQRAQDMRVTAAWTTGAGLLVVLALVYLVANVASRDLRRLAVVASRVGDGDYSPEAREPSRFTPREAVEVWRSMQDMMRILEERRRERTTLIDELQRAGQTSRSLATGLRDAQDGFVVLNRERCIEYTNPAWQRIFGYSFGEVAGRRPAEIDPTREGNAARQRDIEAALDQGQPWSGTIRFQRKDGSRGEADLSISPVFGDDGAVEHYVELVRDVTNKRLAEQALQQSERLASLGMMAAGVAHEINNPMTYVVGNIEQLSELASEGLLTIRPDAEVDLATCLADSLQGARRVIEIVADLRALSQPRSDDGANSANGQQCLDTCLRMAQGQLRHRAEVVKRMPAEELWFQINPQRLSQVLLNLILNAAQAMTEGNHQTNRLTVTMRALGDGRGEISVADTGTGISLEIAQRIFDPFFTTKGTGLGTGLGLSICHSIVTSAQGEIRVDSEVGKGTCFQVTLPLTVAATRAAEPVSGELSGLSILVVDDEPGVLVAIRRMLASCQTTTAGSVKQALELIEERRYDLVLSDVMMTELNGVQLVEMLRARHPELAKRVCLMSGGLLGGELADSVKRMGLRLVHKPMTRRELFDALQAVHAAA
jgi:PAS domain S-box-containing protein